MASSKKLSLLGFLVDFLNVNDLPIANIQIFKVVFGPFFARLTALADALAGQQSPWAAGREDQPRIAG